MNQSIILPRKAIKNIDIKGKDIVLLHKLPPILNFYKDCLVVYEKETGVFFGTIKLETIFYGKSILYLLLRMRKQIAYMEGSLWSYLKPKSCFYILVVYSTQVRKQRRLLRRKAVQ